MEKKLKYPNKERGEAIIKWLEKHPLIARSALAAAVDYDKDNFAKAFTGARAIPATYLDAFEAELSKYGYIPPN